MNIGQAVEVDDMARSSWTKEYRFMRNWIIPTWILVATGLILNIISALMTNFFIDDATRQANELVQQQQNNDKLINLTWQQVESVERKRELVLDLVSSSEISGRAIPDVVNQQMVSDINYWLSNKLDTLSVVDIPTIMTELNKVQYEQREKINQLYLDNLGLVELHSKKMKSISRLRNLSLFLQIIGLALMLARDLKKPDKWEDLN